MFIIIMKHVVNITYLKNTEIVQKFITNNIDYLFLKKISIIKSNFHQHLIHDNITILFHTGKHYKQAIPLNACNVFLHTNTVVKTCTGP